MTTSTLALADEATTYAGTLGKATIIVELQAPRKGGAFVGRYSYMVKGIDIPLHGADVKGTVTIEEEKPCTEEICWTAKNNLAGKAPIGAEWSLKPTSGDAFEGTWTDKDSGKALPIKLVKKGERSLSVADDKDPDLVGDVFSAPEDQTSDVPTSKDLPYDFLKLDHPLKKGEVVKIGDSAYRMDIDSRTGLDFPTVTKLGKADATALNRGLMDQRRRWEEMAFDCLSKAYHGNGWVGVGSEGTRGFDDGDVEVAIDYLTPRLMGFTESGSQDCGGPHPNNFEDHTLVDAKTGKPVTEKDLVADWVARDLDGNIVDPAKAEDPTSVTWGPGDKLLDYLDKNRYESPEGADVDDSVSDDCRTDENMHGNVGVYFKGSDLIFALVNMRYEDSSCGAILAKVPIKDGRPFLTATGARYFAELDK